MEALIERGLTFLMHWKTEGDINAAFFEVLDELRVRGVRPKHLYLRYPDFYAPGYYEVWTDREAAHVFAEVRRVA